MVDITTSTYYEYPSFAIEDVTRTRIVNCKSKIYQIINRFVIVPQNLSLRKPCNTGYIETVSLQCVASNDTCSVFMFSLRKHVQFCTKCYSIDTAIIFKCSHFLLFWILSCLFFVVVCAFLYCLSIRNMTF